VSASNLSRTVLFGPDDLGRPKVAAATDALARLAPDTAAVARHADLVAGVGLGELADAGAVFGCLDSRRARLTLLGRCALVDAPLIDGGTHPWGGEVRLRLDTRDPCHGCTFTAAQRAETDGPAHCDPDPAAPPAPASILSTAVVASWMTAAGIRQLLGTPVPWRFLDIDAVSGRSTPTVARRDPACPHHRPLEYIERVTLDRSATVGELLGILPQGAEPLAWAPFPLPGDCHRCGMPYDFPRGRPHTVSTCPQCGSLQRQRYGQRLRAADPAVKLCDVGIAAEEILAVRMPEGEYRCLRLSR
jgi:molybdopterin/thiamine biosynthesis adenylyltransferase